MKLKLFNITDTPQPVLDSDGKGHTIAAGEGAELPDVDAKHLAASIPDRFSLQESNPKHTPKTKKKEI